jgi:hypothetical protein
VKNCPKQKTLFILLIFAVIDTATSQTTFKFGGYVKLDLSQSKYYNGKVPLGDPLRDFHFPGGIPVGGDSEVFSTIHYHAKESRFYLGTESVIGDHKLNSFVEMDFLLAGQGDEKVSNSWNPRMRHFYFTYADWLFGQTWTTFQILDIPEDLDFAGVADGTIFIRQPMIRFSTGGCQFAIENAQTTLTENNSSESLDSESAFFPDMVARYNFYGNWGNLSIAGLVRQLNYEFTDTINVVSKESTPGFGITFGGKILVGQKDDLRFQVSGGKGLGRYAAVNFTNGAAIKDDNTLEAIPSLLGFAGYRHVWSDQWRSNVNISGIIVNNNTNIVSSNVNKKAWSISANILYSPLAPLTFGVELMRAFRVLENGDSGKFDRLQISAKYDFDFVTTITDK